MATIDVLDLSKAIELVELAMADEGEDFVYQAYDGGTCAYVHGSQVWDSENEEYGIDYSTVTPGCLVGRALIKGGVNPKLFVELHVNEADSDDAIRALERHGVITHATEEALNFLRAVQLRQDRKMPWGQVLGEAKGWLRV